MKNITIDGLNNYHITEDGRVYSSKHNKFLKGNINAKGYLTYWLYRKDGTRLNISSHRLVAIHYLENCSEKLQVNHKDGNKLNNTIVNLEWCTDAENKAHAVKNGLTAKNVNGNKNGKLQGIKIHTSKLTDTEVIRLREEDLKIRLSSGKLPYGCKVWEKWSIGKTQYNNIVKQNYWKHVA